MNGLIDRVCHLEQILQNNRNNKLPPIKGFVGTVHTGIQGIDPNMMPPMLRIGQSSQRSIPWTVTMIWVVALVAAIMPMPMEASAVAAPAAATVKKDPNFVVGIITYVKDQAIQTVKGCGKLYTNHRTCNEIRSKLKANRERVRHQWETTGMYSNESPKEIKQRLKDVTAGITYDDYIFLERGKEDRGKLFNVVFLMFGAPKFLPYALMFNPDMLPSTFTKEDTFQDLPRAPAVLSMLTRVEMEAAKEPEIGLMASVLGQKRDKLQQHEMLKRIVEQTRSVFQNFPNATQLTNGILSKWPVPENRREERLAHLPPVIIQCMNRVVTGQAFPGITAQLSPTFLQRNKLITHLQKVSASDNFLRTNSLEAITSKRLLQEACRDRLLETSQSVDDLRQTLQQWLDTSSTVRGNAALLALLAYNGCSQIRTTRNTNESPSMTQLLYTSPNLVEETVKSRRRSRK